VRLSRLLAVFALLGGTGTLGWLYYRGTHMRPPVRHGVTIVSARANTLDDPLAPGRPPLPDASPRPSDAGPWVTARPSFQYSKTSEQRGGANPCALPEGDASALDPWKSLGKIRFSAPREGAFDASGGFDLVIHFHGDALARRELAESHQTFVLASLTLDPSENYAALFSGTGFYGHLVRGVEAALGESRGKPAHVRHVALTAWSAGYMGVLSMLTQPEAKDVDAVILIDGLHGPRDALDRQLAPFVDFARRAAAGERFFVVTHSSIDPPDFASTTESAHYVISALGARPQAVRRNDRYGLELIEYFTQGNFHVRGYAGNDKLDHCAQVTLLRDAFVALGKRWGR
jgi:hypothetical protein